MSKTHIFVDFDETLFNHMAYASWLDEQLHKMKLSSKKHSSFSQSIDDYHDVFSDKPLVRFYRHAEHMHGVSGKSWELMSGEIEKLIHDQHKDFCYPDAHELLRWLAKEAYDVRVLTFGDGEFQRFKLMICPYLSQNRLPIHVVKQFKKDFLKDNFKDTNGVLIDDRYPLDLPKGWTHIWLDRSEPLKAPKVVKKDVIRISSLAQVPEAIKKGS